MTNASPDPRLRLAIGLTAAGRHPAAWREPGARPTELLTTRWWIDQVRLAQDAMADLVTLEDALGDPPGERTDTVRGRLGAIVLAARIAPVTRDVGLVPVVATALTEPFHVSPRSRRSTTSAGGGRGSSCGRGQPRGRRRMPGAASCPRPRRVAGGGGGGGPVDRNLMVRRAARQTFVGSAETIADELHRNVEERACDGFILVPHITPGGLDRFAGEVVPLLQERGSFRAEYEGTTLREHLGLASPGPHA